MMGMKYCVICLEENKGRGDEELFSKDFRKWYCAKHKPWK